MRRDHLGWLMFIAASGMMCGLLSDEVAQLHTWTEALAPTFVGKAMAHLAVVVAAFIGGKILPAE